MQDKTPRPPIKNILKSSWRLTCELWSKDKRGFFVRILMVCTQISAALLATYFASKTIGLIASRVSGKTSITTWQISQTMIIAGALAAIEQMSLRVMYFYDRRSYLSIGKWAQIAFREKLAEVDTEYLEDREFVKLTNKLEQKVDWAISAYGENIFYSLYSVLRIATIAVLLVSLNWWLLPILLIASLPSLFTQMRESKHQWGIWGEEGDTYHRYYGTMGLFKKQQSLQEIKILGIKQYLLHDVAGTLLDKFQAKQQQINKKSLRPALLARLSESTALVLAELWMLGRLLAGRLTLTSFSFYTGVIAQYNSAIGLLLGTVERMYEQSLYVNDLYELLDTPPRMPQPAIAKRLEKDLIPTIEFQDVSFCYPGSKRYIFNGLNIKIEPGQDVALVGENGAGKSTLIKLLLRLYDPTAGRILINNQDLKELDIGSWYRHVSVLFQQFNHYPFDIADNIQIGQIRHQDPEQIKNAASLAGLNKIIDELPSGLQTVLDPSFEKGIEPSGGQWQRVALARAFYRSASILILDEPTAAIDANAEYEIFNSIFEYQKKRTTIIVSHRFSTVRNADRIIVLDKGRVVEDGSHDQLLKNDGLYQQMFERQAKGYK